MINPVGAINFFQNSGWGVSLILRRPGGHLLCLQTVFARRDQAAAADLFHQGGGDRRQQADDANFSEHKLFAICRIFHRPRPR